MVLRASTKGGKENQKSMEADGCSNCRAWLEGRRDGLWQPSRARESGTSGVEAKEWLRESRAESF
eukprot:560900-Karenia_brevis.AAC.1